MPTIKEGNALIADLEKKDVSATARATVIGRALKSRFIDAYVKDPPPATFRFIVSPLVTWIWLGALIVFGGGLIAMWPGPDAARRRASARAAARVAEDLGRTEARTAVVDVAAALVILAVVCAVAWIVSAPLRGGGEADGGEVADRVAELGRAAMRSTARSATRSSISRPASSPRRTIARWIGSCVPRRPRSCANSTKLSPDAVA